MRTTRHPHRTDRGLAAPDHLLGRRAWIPALIFAVLAAATGCGGGGKQAERDAADADPAHMSGRSYFRFTCSPCHGREGRGMAGLYPPLRGGSWVNADPSVPIRIVLKGLEGEITVDGVRYMNKMPPQGAQLPDEKIAAILSYLRASWGNVGTPVTATDVARVRAETSERANPWTGDEIRAFMTGGASPAP
jgi:mono/diheme cytochrome c family protein